MLFSPNHRVPHILQNPFLIAFDQFIEQPQRCAVWNDGVVVIHQDSVVGMKDSYCHMDCLRFEVEIRESIIILLLIAEIHALFQNIPLSVQGKLRTNIFRGLLGMIYLATVLKLR